MSQTRCQVKYVKQKKSLEKIFQEINRTHVRIKKQEKFKNNIVLNTVLEELLKTMRKCDPLFNTMNPRLEYLGSYYDGLRVGKPTEYDLNVILTMHINYDEIKLEAREYAYSAIKMPKEFRLLSANSQTADKGFKETKFWCDSSYYLLRERFRSWMQKVVACTLFQLPKKNGKPILKVKDKEFIILLKTSGPAMTLSIYVDDNYKIDLDLVPTLQFSLPKVPVGTQIKFDKIRNTKKNYYFAVPKPNKDEYSWRLAFPYQERFYLENKNNLKSTLKLLKLFRDVQGFTKLASYFIKTLFLWEIEDLGKETFWKKNSLTYLVIFMLGKLRDCLAIATIRNYWCPEHNLLEKVKQETCRNWANRITRVIRIIEENKVKNPNVVKKYFTEQEVGTT